MRRLTPSAPSMRMVVASVNGRRPDSTFSNVEMLIFATSARPRRDMRRRASSSRMRFAIRRLCCSERLCSVTGAFPSRSVHLRTNPHNLDSGRAQPLPNKTGKDARGARGPGRTKSAQFPRTPLSTPPDGAEESGDEHAPHPPSSPWRSSRHPSRRPPFSWARQAGTHADTNSDEAPPPGLRRRPFAL